MRRDKLIQGIIFNNSIKGIEDKIQKLHVDCKNMIGFQNIPNYSIQIPFDLQANYEKASDDIIAYYNNEIKKINKKIEEL